MQEIAKAMGKLKSALLARRKLNMSRIGGIGHMILTDDASGIETHRHRRFADRRATATWFSLTGEDVRAFFRRNFQ